MSTATRSASAERFAARARRRRLRGVLRSVLILLVIGAVVAGVWLVRWSSVLSVQNVSVQGVPDDVAVEVEETAEVPVGVPLIDVDTAAVAERVRALPDVGDVEVRRSWPQTLTIDVEPREALAAIRDGGTWWSVDASGVLFGRADSRPDGVPELDAPTEDAATLARETGVAVLTQLPRSVEELVDSVEARSAADVRLHLADGSTVRWGTAERPEDKARVLLALMQQRQEDDESEPPEMYDVAAPDHPAVVP
ncbi:cell division protein FtsQ/DivIB [Phytoactinopolyspora halotolerans]|uniref:FtsQ-type POTRA domain-containing protein n=1 Tax=Phytoactinopolyspora halotolerans TaxID=1981512 RepID=A0A6L9SCI5_9ACTN|nr:FtsQ-type POTRA domain-containing protein [Phytoactinopolyspora halotolerans]NEE03095.1 FtsQ-type POTRA domain-containing protein [Phytoactinopolyspora halotolerans]